VHGEDKIERRYLVIAEGHADKPGPIVQVQLKSRVACPGSALNSPL
jgi:hypothetical protein